MNRSPYTAAAIANFFIKKNSIAPTDLTHLKIQKLLFFAQGWFMANFGMPLFDENFEAWRHGPVVRSIYSALSGSGNSIITNEINQVFTDEHGQTTYGAPQISESDKTAIDFLEEFWNVYSPIHAYALSSATHKHGTPWHKTFERYGNWLPYGAEIYNEDIHNYFSSLKLHSEAENAGI